MKPFLADGLISQITEANAVTLIAGSTSANVQLFNSGTPTTAVVSNPGNIPAWVALGSSSVTATVGSGTLVAPGASVVLSLGKLQAIWPVSRRLAALCFKLLLVRKVPGKPAGKENAHTLAGGSLSDLWTFLFLGV